MPMPPANFSGLSVDELHAMEGHERQAVEARIQCLRDIQTLLNAAFLQMQQYTDVAPPSGQYYSAGGNGRPTEAPTSATSTFSATTSPATTVTTSVLQSPRPAPGSPASDSSPTPGCSNGAAAVETDDDAPGAVGGVRSEPTTDGLVENIDNAEDDNGELGEIRRRRLQHFSSSDLKNMDES